MTQCGIRQPDGAMGWVALLSAALVATLVACENPKEVAAGGDASASASGNGDAVAADAADATSDATADAGSAGDADTAVGEDASSDSAGGSDGSQAEDGANPTDSGDNGPDGGGDGGGADSSAPILTNCTSIADCTAKLPACQGWTCQADACIAVTINNGAPCDDGNACSLGDQCSVGGCTATAQVACDDGNPCTTDSCASQSGTCASIPMDATPCDDGLACTLGDSCQNGKCSPGKSFCACQGDSDCPDDDDVCNGKPYCDKGGLSWQCKVKPGSAVVCLQSDGQCTTLQCQASSGQCLSTPKADGLPCNDGDPCSAGDACAAGQCKGPLDTCICKSQADCGALEDGDLCNGTLYCDLGDHTCKVNPKTVVQCASGNDGTCLKNSCDPKIGKCALLPVKEGTPCDDGNSCTAGDHCQAGWCAKAANVCKCTSDSECSAKDDKDLCNGTLYCDKAVGACKVNPATVVSCPALADQPCLSNVCQKATGSCEAVALPDGATCDADGNSCTTTDSCSKGACIADENVCDCQSTFDCKSKEDGDLCNGQLYCDKTVAKCKVNPATVVFCPYAGDTACLKNTCDGSTGTCFYKPATEGQPCDADGNPCSPDDSCVQGSCVADALTCDCQSNADCAAKEDGDLCNGSLFCDKGKCVVNPATVV